MKSYRLPQQRYKQLFTSSRSWAVVFFLIILGLSFTVPIVSLPASQADLLKITSFLFSIFVGLLIGRLYKRYNTINLELATESSYYLQLYRTAHLLNKTVEKKAIKLIDDHYRQFMDYPLGKEYAHASRHSLDQMGVFFQEIKGEDYSNKVDHYCCNWFFRYWQNLGVIRKKVLAEIAYFMPSLQWFFVVIISLAFMYFLFFLRDGTVMVNLFVTLLLTGIFGLLLVARDYERLRIRGLQIGYSHIGVVFDAIGEAPYYNIHDLFHNYAMTVNFTGKVRMGVHNPGETPEVYLLDNPEQLQQLVRGNTKGLKKYNG